MIKVYNRLNEDYSSYKNNYPIFRGTILGNPYTDKPLKKTLAIFQVSSREEAIKKYREWFDISYQHKPAFKKIIDEIYEKYKNKEDIYLECYCKPLDCHGDVIAEKIKQRFLKEKIKEELEHRKHGTK